MTRPQLRRLSKDRREVFGFSWGQDQVANNADANFYRCQEGGRSDAEIVQCYVQTTCYFFYPGISKVIFNYYLKPIMVNCVHYYYLVASPPLRIFDVVGILLFISLLFLLAAATKNLEDQLSTTALSPLLEAVP